MAHFLTDTVVVILWLTSGYTATHAQGHTGEDIRTANGEQARVQLHQEGNDNVA